MKYLSKAPFSSPPSTAAFREGFDGAFGVRGSKRRKKEPAFDFHPKQREFMTSMGRPIVFVGTGRPAWKGSPLSLALQAGDWTFTTAKPPKEKGRKRK